MKASISETTQPTIQKVDLVQLPVQNDRVSIKRRLIENIIDFKNRVLIIAWLLAVCSVLYLLQYMQTNVTQFFGLAESREQTISFQHAVEIIQIPVVEGEVVEKNAPLLKALRYDLDEQQSIVEDNISELQTRHNQSIKETDSKLKELNSKHDAKVAQITTKINKLISRHGLNQKLIKDISGDSYLNDSVVNSPLLTEIKGLKTTRNHIKQTLSSQIDNLHQQLKSNVHLFNTKIEKLKTRKQEFQRQAEELKVVAEFNGSIGSINFKPGEQVRPFKPIITLHSEYPNFIKGYIHEQVVNNVRMGQPVWLKSMGSPSNNRKNKTNLIHGVVESLGSRVVEYPDRLKRSKMISVWGREVVIRLTDKNNFLLGEKVRILLADPSAKNNEFINILHGIFSKAMASAFINNAPQPIFSSLPNLTSNEIEASGVLWDKSNNTYHLISDENNRKRPYILEMNTQGNVISKLPIIGGVKIDDMESISVDSNYFYVLSSLSHNKKGVLKPKRRKMIRLERENNHFISRGEVDLYSVLKKISKNGMADLETSNFLSQAIKNKTLEIESHNIVNNDLYIGFKHPFDKNENSVIIKISGVKALFSGQLPMSAKIWLSLDLSDPESGRATALTDMFIQDKKIFLLSVNNHKNHLVSHFWIFDLDNKKLSLINSYPNKKAEGIAYNKNAQEVIIVFDEGGKAPSQFILKGVDFD